MSDTAIVWFRRDLRLADNPALSAAIEAGHERLLPLFIHDPDEMGDEAPGGAQRVWLHDSLTALASQLEALGSKLVIRSGPALAVMNTLIEQTRIVAVYWNRLYEPALRARDETVKSSLLERGLSAQSFKADVLHEPWTVETGQGRPYKVFTPFWRAIRDRRVDAPLARPAQLAAPPGNIAKSEPGDLDLLPAHAWADKLRRHWQPGETGAHERLEYFLDGVMDDYRALRERPAVYGSSFLSPHLHWGEIGPRQILRGVDAKCNGRENRDADIFFSEVGWREFARHVLYHFPETTDQPMDKRFEQFPWRDDPQDLRAWQRGRTGIPMVDAGMRELWATGTMHNRLRMTVASFLTKNLRIAWQHGERWFWDTLFDADRANNTLGWQWAAGSGADAAPFFRIFNPVRQGERFDPGGTYVRRWVPEIAKLPDRHIHAPWQAPTEVLKTAGVTLGQSYPEPIVDLKQSRKDALAAFETLKTAD